MILLKPLAPKLLHYVYMSDIKRVLRLEISERWWYNVAPFCLAVCNTNRYILGKTDARRLFDKKIKYSYLYKKLKRNGRYISAL